VNHATTATRERPIIFSAPMIRAILEGCKTMTRRVVKPQPKFVQQLRDGRFETSPDGGFDHDVSHVRCPYVPGSLLWVKEAFAEFGRRHRSDGSNQRRLLTYYKATHVGEITKPWKSPLFMPYHASRLTLEITAVRVERLWQITEADVLAEGIKPLTLEPKRTFIDLWDKINGKRPGCAWKDNPWVWVIEFRRADA
jgi:hypothetical protein